MFINLAAEMYIKSLCYMSSIYTDFIFKISRRKFHEAGTETLSESTP